MKIYKYSGDGAGIPGLPHEIPESEAAQYGAALTAAVEAGVYEVVGVSKETPSRKAKAADTSAEGD